MLRLLLLGGVLTGCVAHVVLPPPPAATAPEPERVAALRALSPVSAQETAPLPSQFYARQQLPSFLLLRSGLSMMATLDLTRNVVHNRAVAETLQTMRNSVERGGGLEEPMRQSAAIPSVVADMFVTGEESGRVDDVAQQIAGVYEQEVRIAVESLGEAIQPIFTVVVGVFVLILFVSLFLPMIHMIDQLGGQTTGG